MGVGVGSFFPEEEAVLQPTVVTKIMVMSKIETVRRDLACIAYSPTCILTIHQANLMQADV